MGEQGVAVGIIHAGIGADAVDFESQNAVRCRDGEGIAVAVLQEEDVGSVVTAVVVVEIAEIRIFGELIA